MLNTVVLIDGANINQQVRLLNQGQLDYGNVKERPADKCNLIRTVFFTAIHEDENGERRLQKLVDYLQYNGFKVVSKPTRQFDSKIKGNMDVEIAEMVRAAEYAEMIILFSGDGDFIPVVQYCQNKGVQVLVVSTLEARGLSDELRREADDFIELALFLKDQENDDEESSDNAS